MTENEYGMLVDHQTGQQIRPATREEREASDAAGENGVFALDRDGDIDDKGLAVHDPDVFGPPRYVFVTPS